MKPLVSMRRALSDPNLLGTMMEGDSWKVWKSLLIASRGEELTPDELELFTERTGRIEAPTEPVDESAFIAGRRSGKTVAAACLAIYLTALCDWGKHLVRGERGVMLFLAQSQKTARVAFNYAKGAFEDIPMLAQLVRSQTADTISLQGGIDLEIRPASFRGLRGMTAIGVIADELAVWHSDDSVNPDVEILAAVRPALATTGGPLIMVSSPYARRGELWETYRRHYGPDGDPKILVAKGASRDFNQTLSQKVVDRALEKDPHRYGAEYLGEFRTDVEGYLSLEALQACASGDERAPDRHHRYIGFVDPSGGSRDSFTLAISHKEGDTIVLDCLRETRPPFSPEAVTAEYAAVLRNYRCSTVRGDRYAGEYPREQFRKHGVYYEVSDKPKSDIYTDFAPLVNSQAVDLLDNERLIHQLSTLERKTGRSGKDIVDHGPGGHDDLANACAGAVVAAMDEPSWAAKWPEPTYVKGLV